MRNEVLMESVDRAVSDPKFRGRLVPTWRTLRGYGYDLTAEEFAAFEKFRHQTERLTDEEADRALVANSGRRRQFGG